MELSNEFSKIAHYFSNLAVEETKYVTIYPIHPYVIKVSPSYHSMKKEA